MTNKHHWECGCISWTWTVTKISHHISCGNETCPVILEMQEQSKAQGNELRHVKFEDFMKKTPFGMICPKCGKDMKCIFHEELIPSRMKSRYACGCGASMDFEFDLYEE